MWIVISITGSQSGLVRHKWPRLDHREKLRRSLGAFEDRHTQEVRLNQRGVQTSQEFWNTSYFTHWKWSLEDPWCFSTYFFKKLGITVKKDKMNGAWYSLAAMIGAILISLKDVFRWSRRFSRNEVSFNTKNIFRHNLWVKRTKTEAILAVDL